MLPVGGAMIVPEYCITVQICCQVKVSVFYVWTTVGNEHFAKSGVAIFIFC